MKKILTASTLFFFQSSLALAQTNPGTVASRLKTIDDVINLAVCPLLNIAFAVIVILSTVMVIYAAFLYLFGGADPQKVSQAHKVITYAAIGFAVALLAKGFPAVVASILGAKIKVPC